jgi:RNA polymerase sigma-70 factor (ECF subfamily)
MHGSSQNRLGARCVTWRSGIDCKAAVLFLTMGMAGALLGVKGLAETGSGHDAIGRRRAPETALDEALAAVATGDRDALRTVYDLTRAKLYGIVLGLLKDREAAEDVLQSVYLTVWRKAAGFDSGRASPITWLATIARNRAIDRLRRSPPERVDALDDLSTIADSAPGPERLAGLSEDYRRLEQCLGRLDETHARAVRRAFLDGETYSALAERMSVPLGTLKSWIRRSLLKLRDCLAV